MYIYIMTGVKRMAARLNTDDGEHLLKGSAGGGNAEARWACVAVQH